VDTVRETFALCVGYLLGSVLPADLLARMRGVDIRAVGTRNPGTTNALQQLGTAPGLVTMAYDGSVGLVSMYVASLLGLSLGWTYLAGVAAIVGHIFPLFSRFRGGQGMAAATGILLYEIGVALSRGSLSIPGIALLALVGLVVFGLTRSATLVGVVTAPLLVAQVLLGPADWPFAAFMAALAGFIWAVQVGIARQNRLFRLAGPARPAPRG
jgi:glycerol-3-phosphate acyltransferase PlsY